MAAMIIVATLLTSGFAFADGGGGGRHGNNGHHGNHGNNGHSGGSCHQPTPPTTSCECDGKMQNFTVVYSGNSGVNVRAKYKGRGNRWNTFQTFYNVQNGDTLTINGFDRHGRLGSKTRLEIGCNSEEIHTSCSENILGNTYGPYRVISYTDGDGNYCENNPPPPPPPADTTCECEGKMQNFTVLYNGASGLDLDASNKGTRNRWYVFESFTSIQDGDLITVTGFDHRGRLGPKTRLEVGGETYEIHTSCSEDIMGNVYGPFTVVAYTDGEGNVCDNTPPPPPTGCVYDYYLSRNSNNGDSEVYAVTLNGNNAELELIGTFSEAAHLAFDQSTSELYLIFNTNPLTIRSYNVASGTYGPLVTFNGTGGVIQATFLNGELYIGSGDDNMIYTADYTNGTISPVASLNISGGDLSFTATGELWSASNSTASITQVGLSGGANSFVAPLASTTVGLALMPTGSFLLSEQQSNQLKVLDASGNWTGDTYALTLNGAPFTQNNGDLAVGCTPITPPVDPCASFNYYLSQNNKNFVGDGQLYGVTLNGSNAEMTLIADLGHKSHLAMDRLNGIVYIINNKLPSSSVYTYDIATGTFSPEVEITGLSETVQAVYHDGTLYVGTTNGDGFIAEVDPTTGSWNVYIGAPVDGGDLVVDTLGNLLMATRFNNQLIGYDQFGDPYLFSSIPSTPTGIALALDGSFLLSRNGYSDLVGLNDDGSLTGNNYTLTLNGSTYVAADGDLTSGCGEFVLPASNKRGSEETAETAKTELIDIADAASAELKIYPNPSTGLVTVEYNAESTDLVTFEVYNSVGQLVHTFSNNGLVKQTIDVSTNNAGLYLVNIMVNGKQVSMQKLLITK